jgi:glycosyltransferase involved in cell wall biosynthesis
MMIQKLILRKKMRPKLAIILPCFNPPVDWVVRILEVWQSLKTLISEADLSLILVNDGSKIPLDAADILRLKKTIIDFTLIENIKNSGKGHAVRLGAKNAETDYFIFTDIDFPFETDSLLRVFEALKNGADVVCGAREKYQTQLKPIRKFFSFGSHILNRWILRLPFQDTQGGLKGFNQKGRTIFLQGKINRYLFDTEFILRVLKQPDVSLRQVKIFARPDILLTEMSLKILKNEFLNIFLLIKIRFF